MLMVDVLAPEHEHRDVDGGERDEQQQHRGVCEGAQVPRGDEDQSEDGRKDDRGDWRPPALQDPAEEARHDPLLGHAVDQARGHDHVDQRAVGERE